jgi:hypothetical protein
VEVTVKSFSEIAQVLFGMKAVDDLAQALRMELRIAHAVSVGLKIMEAAAGLLRTRYLAPDGGE